MKWKTVQVPITTQKGKLVQETEKKHKVCGDKNLTWYSGLRFIQLKACTLFEQEKTNDWKKDIWSFAWCYCRAGRIYSKFNHLHFILHTQLFSIGEIQTFSGVCVSYLGSDQLLLWKITFDTPPPKKYCIQMVMVCTQCFIMKLQMRPFPLKMS